MKKIRLGDLIDIVGGSQPPKSKFIYEEKEGYVRLVQIRDFRNDNFKTYIPIDKKNKIFSKDDYLIARYGQKDEYATGRVGDIYTGLEGAYNVALMKIVFKSDLLIKKYLYYLFKSKQLIDNITSNSDRTTIPAVDKERLLDYEINLPSIEEQERIVAILDQVYENIGWDIDDKIANLKALKKSAIDKAIRGQLTTQNLLESAEDLYKSIQDEKEKLIKEGKIKKSKKDEIKPITEDEIPFEIPNNWKWCRLGEVSQLINGDRGSNYPTKNDFKNRGIPFINAGNMQSNLNIGDFDYITLEKFNEMSSGKVNLNDILYCLRGTVGRNVLINKCEKAFIASTLIIIRTLKPLNHNYLNYYLNSNLEENLRNRNIRGSAQPSLSGESLSTFLIPLPPLEEQEGIGNILSAIDSAIDSAIEMQEDNKKLLNSLLNKFLNMVENNID